jgi:hypothetical protein
MNKTLVPIRIEKDLTDEQLIVHFESEICQMAVLFEKNSNQAVPLAA